MADEVSPEVIQSTQKLLGKHVAKPQLSEKLLKKPPFRFLHDVIVALVRNGFLKGLYTDEELNSENVKDRESKIAFLNKLITAVKTLSGKDLQAKSSKIIAGLDASETNRLLQTIGRLIDDKVDTRDYVKNFKKSSKDANKPGDVLESTREKKASSKTSLTKSTDKLDSIQKKTDKKPARKGSDASPKDKDSITPKTKTNAKKKPEKTSSRTSVASKDSKTSNVSKSSVTKTTSKEKKYPKAESKTSTPKTPSDTSSKGKDNKKSPKNEVEGPPETVEAPKAEPTDVSPRDDSWKPQELKENKDGDHDQPPSYRETEINKNVVDYSSVVQPKQNGENVEEEAPPVRRPSARPKSARPRSGSSDQRTPAAQIRKEVKTEVKNDVKPEQKKPVMATRDFSMKSAAKENRESSSISMRNKENTNPEEEKEAEEIKRATPVRPKSSMLRPPSVRPSSARPGAPRLRPESSIPIKEVIPLGKIKVIVENYDAQDTNQDEDEDETVVIQSVPDEPSAENNFTEKSLNLDIPTDKGHLVEQILEQMQDGRQGEKAQLEWEIQGSKSKDATTKEITALRASIQALTKTANPLGKLASYLHEDVEAMHSELETWLNMKQQYAAEIAKQKRVNNESNQPLLQQLRNLEEAVKHERDEIAAIKYNVLRNEERIRHLVSKQIAID